VRKQTAAARTFKEWLQRAVSCVTREVLVVSPGGYEPSPPDSDPHTVSFRDDPIPLAGPAKLFLSVNHHYRLVRPTGTGRWKVQTAAYFYEFDDVQGRELLAFHWHPDTPGAVPYPHLHVGPGVVQVDSLVAAGLSAQHNALRPELQGAHIPTSRIALEQVLALALQHFNVPPLRTNWESVFQSTLADFQRSQSWHIWPTT
jgi:hypothetical protein